MNNVICFLHIFINGNLNIAPPFNSEYSYKFINFIINVLEKKIYLF